MIFVVAVICMWSVPVDNSTTRKAKDKLELCRDTMQEISILKDTGNSRFILVTCCISGATYDCSKFMDPTIIPLDRYKLEKEVK